VAPITSERVTEVFLDELSTQLRVSLPTTVRFHREVAAFVDPLEKLLRIRYPYTGSTWEFEYHQLHGDAVRNARKAARYAAVEIRADELRERSPETGA
jgi:hypothetical protein